MKASLAAFAHLGVRAECGMGGKLHTVISYAPSSLGSVHISRGYSKPKYDDMYTSKACSYPSSICFQACQTVKNAVTSRGFYTRSLQISLPCQTISMRFVVPKQGLLRKIKCSIGPMSWPQGCIFTGLISGLLIYSSSSEPVHAEAYENKDNEKCEPSSSEARFSHGKKVYTDYSVIGIPGDGRCLFRSVAHGAFLRSGKQAPHESLQREMADELRARVADEFIKRREETEWFIEGDFDNYVAQMRKPHVWGGEPELLMVSHVLKMPITVFMNDGDAGGLIAIAEYGQEYGKENPIRVLYHGFGHYDALQIPGRRTGKSKL